TRIQHPGDVGMIHQSKGLAFRFEPRDHALGIHAELDDLQSHAPPDRFLLLGHIDHAAPAFSDLLKQFVTPNTVTRLFRYRNRTDRGIAPHTRILTKNHRSLLTWGADFGLCLWFHSSRNAGQLQLPELSSDVEGLPPPTQE